MGYRYIAIGGLARSQSGDILRVLEAVHEVVPLDVKIHVFALARLPLIRDFIRLGVTSIDSASMLRKAWLGFDRNYLTENGWYSAIRIPHAELSFRAKRVVSDGRISLQALKDLEEKCLSELRTFAQTSGSPPESLLGHLMEYDALIAGQRRGTRERIGRTLEDRVWQRCRCSVCLRWGVEVLIFRGNNRNRRRGFHNTHMFYEMLDDVAGDQAIPKLSLPQAAAQQLDLFETLRGLPV